VSVTSDSHTIEYLYDAQDKRVGKQLDGVIQERYIYDGDDIALVVNAMGTLIERYLYGDSTDSVLAVERDGTISWSLGDRQGSVVDLVDEGGTVLNHFVYDSFGSRTQASGVEFRYGYTGRELDAETGLYYYRARYYDPTVGRFISEDPMGFGAGDTNLYRYVGNNATNYTDPTGMTISGWGEDLLNGADQFAAGFANVVSFGITNKLRSQFYGQVATQNQEGLLYNIGTGFGIVATLALNPSGAGAAVAKGAASGYQVVGNAYGIYDSTKNVLSGEGSAWDLLNLAPAAGALFHNRQAILKAGDNAADAVWRGIDNVLGNNHQPQLVLAESRLASATRVVDDVEVASHQFAMTTSRTDGDTIAHPSIPSLTAEIPTNNNGFDDWFDNKSSIEIGQIFADKSMAQKIKNQLRGDGGKHEFLMVAEAPKWKEWGVTAQQVKEDFAISISDLNNGLAKGWKHSTGGLTKSPGSKKVHNELQQIIKSSNSLDDFKTKMVDWADKWIEGGYISLPKGFHDTGS
jgi:RHS repeat-associated protein